MLDGPLRLDQSISIDRGRERGERERDKGKGGDRNSNIDGLGLGLGLGLQLNIDTSMSRSRSRELERRIDIDANGEGGEDGRCHGLSIDPSHPISPLARGQEQGLKGRFLQHLQQSDCGLFSPPPLFRLKCLGRGASSIVYSAVQLPSLALCAEKVVSANDLSKQKNIYRELQALEALGRAAEGVGLGEKSGDMKGADHVVRLLGLFFSPRSGLFSLSLTLLSVSLQAWIDGRRAYLANTENNQKTKNIPNNQSNTIDCESTSQPLSEEVLISIAQGMSSGLRFIHSRGIIHRDIKPDNVLVDCAGSVKIADFGISKQLRQEGGKQANKAEDWYNCSTLTFIGTPEFMSPERVMGGPYGMSADVWGLGLTLLALSVGDSPTRAAAANISTAVVKDAPGGGGAGYFSVLETIGKLDAPRLLSAKGYSKAWQGLVQACLEQDVSRRATAAAALDASMGKLGFGKGLALGFEETRRSRQQLLRMSRDLQSFFKETNRPSATRQTLSSALKSHQNSSNNNSNSKNATRSQGGKAAVSQPAKKQIGKSAAEAQPMSARGASPLTSAASGPRKQTEKSPPRAIATAAGGKVNPRKVATNAAVGTKPAPSKVSSVTGSKGPSNISNLKEKERAGSRGRTSDKPTTKPDNRPISVCSSSRGTAVTVVAPVALDAKKCDAPSRDVRGLPDFRTPESKLAIWSKGEFARDRSFVYLDTRDSVVDLVAAEQLTIEDGAVKALWESWKEVVISTLSMNEIEKLKSELLKLENLYFSDNWVSFEDKIDKLGELNRKAEELGDMNISKKLFGGKLVENLFMLRQEFKCSLLDLIRGIVEALGALIANKAIDSSLRLSLASNAFVDDGAKKENGNLRVSGTLQTRGHYNLDDLLLANAGPGSKNRYDDQNEEELDGYENDEFVADRSPVRGGDMIEINLNDSNVSDGLFEDLNESWSGDEFIRQLEERGDKPKSAVSVKIADAKSSSDTKKSSATNGFPVSQPIRSMQVLEESFIDEVLSEAEEEMSQSEVPEVEESFAYEDDFES